MQNCASCHGAKLEGVPPEFPALTGWANKYLPGEIRRPSARAAGACRDSAKCRAAGRSAGELPDYRGRQANLAGAAVSPTN